MKLNFIEIKLIEKWYELNTRNRFGDNIFYIGEETSIIDKINKKKKDFNANKEIEVDIDFTYTELSVLKNWAESSDGIYEEERLIKKIEKELKISKDNLLNFIRKKIDDEDKK
jgi:hypothetical protein